MSIGSAQDLLNSPHPDWPSHIDNILRPQEEIRWIDWPRSLVLPLEAKLYFLTALVSLVILILVGFKALPIIFITLPSAWASWRLLSISNRQIYVITDQRAMILGRGKSSMNAIWETSSPVWLKEKRNFKSDTMMICTSMPMSPLSFAAMPPNYVEHLQAEAISKPKISGMGEMDIGRVWLDSINYGVTGFYNLSNIDKVKATLPLSVMPNK